MGGVTGILGSGREVFRRRGFCSSDWPSCERAEDWTELKDEPLEGYDEEYTTDCPEEEEDDEEAVEQDEGDRAYSCGGGGMMRGR